MTYHSCPRCGHWHDVAMGCDQRVALEAYVSVTESQLASADAAETSVLARYLNRRRGR